MALQTEYDRNGYSHSEGDLESPFLQEEPCGGKSDNEWQAHLGALEAETPFRATTEEIQHDLFERQLGGGTSAMSPFPSPFADLTCDTGKLQAAFAAALSSVKADGTTHGLVDLNGKPLDVDKIPITIVSLNLDGTTSAVGQHDTEMYYSGSLLKIAAMHAAFQLRHAVNELAATLKPGTPDELFKQVHHTFDPRIKSAVQLLTARGFHQVPKYETIFTATKGANGRYTVDFREDRQHPRVNFHGHLNEMVVNSHNPSAGFCIQALGYNWINGVMEHSGFFRNSCNGIWLAGDYLPNPVIGNDDESKEIRALGLVGGRVALVDSLNDKLVKQATTCIDAAKMFVYLAKGELVGNALNGSDAANDEMLAMLAAGVHGHGAPSRLAERADPHPLFTVLHSKIGLAQLKGGSCNTYHRCVSSEVSIIQHAGGRQFVTMWQNLNEAGGRHFHLIVEIIQRTMDNFLSPP